MPAGTEDDPFTHNLGGDRGWKWCRCATCGRTGICEPQSDFYGTVGGGALRCEDCFRKWLQENGLGEMRRIDGEPEDPSGN